MSNGRFQSARSKVDAMLAIALMAGDALVVAAFAAVALLSLAPALTAKLSDPPAPVSVAVVVSDPGPSTDAAALVNPRQQMLAGYLSQRFGVAFDVAEEAVGAASTAGERTGLDPLLVLAVVAVESSFNPVARSSAGARGLMQIIPKYHEEVLEAHGGAVFDTRTNILVGTQVLDQYARQSGSLELGLQRYNGAVSDASARYAQKVFMERERLKQVVDRFEPPTLYGMVP